MRGAVVTAFRRMLEVRRVLRHEALENLLEVAVRGQIGVLHHDEATTRVSNEHGHRSRLGLHSPSPPTRVGW